MITFSCSLLKSVGLNNISHQPQKAPTPIPHKQNKYKRLQFTKIELLYYKFDKQNNNIVIYFSFVSR